MMVDDLSDGPRDGTHNGSENRIGTVGEIRHLRRIPQDQGNSSATRNQESSKRESGNGKRGYKSPPISDEDYDRCDGKEFKNDEYDNQDRFADSFDFVSLPFDEKESED